MAQLKPDCRGAGEVTMYLSSLGSNFRTHKYIFRDDTCMVQYAPDHIGSWAYHTDCDMHKTSMIDPNTWGQDLEKNNSPCLHNLDLFVGEIPKMYSNKDRRLNVARKIYNNLPQGYYNSNPNIWTYANQLRWNCREAEWDDMLFQLMLLDMLRVG